MFLGHFAVGFAAKKWAPAISLGTLFLAAQFVDLLWPAFLLMGIEGVRIDPGNTAVTPLDFHDYPITHSLLTSLGWSLLLGLLIFAIKKSLRGAVVVGFVVFSHWLLDFVTHRPDLPLFPGSDFFFGLGLWNSVAGTLSVEFAMYAAALLIYAKVTRPKNRLGTVLLYAFGGLFAMISLGNIFGPPPPSEEMIAIAGNSGWLLIAAGYWLDRHRGPRDAVAG